jgi:UDP-N-acetylmuramate dehydrogenase
MPKSANSIPLTNLRQAFGARLQENVSMANYTTAHVGGRADAMLIVHDAAELESAVRQLWELETPFFIFGSGSNVLVSDSGFRGLVLVNRAKTVRIDTRTEPPTVWAESGANLGGIARQCALRGLSGLEWSASIPGTLGGAVYGNAGAHGGDLRTNLVLAEILHQKQGRVNWTLDQMQYDYRTSALKKQPNQAVILAARLKLVSATPAEVQAKMDENIEKRRSTQPPGASLGSMFKNPAGDYAGRLIEAAGLKGSRVGGVQVSPIHANFFVNDDSATASDFYQLIHRTQQTVADKFGVQLELEIEMIGDWTQTGRKKA